MLFSTTFFHCRGIASGIRLLPLLLLPALGSAAEEPGALPRSIVGGEGALLADYPFVVYVTGGCTGSLIAPSWVLTTAKCAVNDKGRPRGGLTIEHGYGTVFGYRSRQARKITPHPQYDANSLRNNIALIKLSSPLPSAFAVPLGIPRRTAEQSHAPSGTSAVAIGYGLKEKNRHSEQIRSFSASLYHPDYCRSQLVFKDEVTVANADTLCAGTAQKRINTGDEGGPLVVAYSGSGDQEWLLVGVASRRAVDNAGSDVTSIFARVSSYVAWIHKTTDGAASLVASTPVASTPAPAESTPNQGNNDESQSQGNGDATQSGDAAEESFSLSRWTFYPGSTVAFEPTNSTRPEIGEDAFLPAGGRRWFGQLRLYRTGKVDIKFVSTQAGRLDDQADLSDAWENGGQLVIEAGGRTLTINMADTTDSTEPYEFTPTNSADVIAFFNAMRGRGLQTTASTVTLRLPGTSSSNPAESTPTPPESTPTPAESTPNQGNNGENQGDNDDSGDGDAAEESFTLSQGAFYSGTTLAFEPSGNTRPEIEGEAYLPASGRRWFGLLRLHPDGTVHIKFVSTQAGSLDDQADLSDAWEERGQLVIEAGGRTLTINMAETTDSTEPYEFTPTNSADVIAFYNAFRSRAQGSLASTVTLRFPGSPNSGDTTDGDDDDGPTIKQITKQLKDTEAAMQAVYGNVQKLRAEQAKLNDILFKLQILHRQHKSRQFTKYELLTTASELVEP